MKIIKSHLKNGQYYTARYPKTSIFFHHTVSGSAKSSLDWWDQTPEVVGTQYIIERDGTIIEAAPPECYLYHLGVPDDDNYFEKHTINIELVSWGRLTKNGEVYLNTYNQRVPKEEVYHLKKPYKEQSFFHRYTQEQIDSSLWLICHLQLNFGIEIKNDLSKLCEYDPNIVKEKVPGLYTHGMVRKGKDDIFPQLNFLNAIRREFGN